MVKVLNKGGFIGGRVRKVVEVALDRWTDDHLKPKNEVIEFAVKEFLQNVSLQKKFIKIYCKDNEHC